jgi:hypothetical protein
LESPVAAACGQAFAACIFGAISGAISGIILTLSCNPECNPNWCEVCPHF